MVRAAECENIEQCASSGTTVAQLSLSTCNRATSHPVAVAAILGVRGVKGPPPFPEWGVTYKAVTPQF